MTEHSDDRSDEVFDDLNLRQLRFVYAYLLLGKGGPAARKAGYSAKSSEQQASALLKTPKVSEAIAHLRSKVMQDAEVTIADVARELHAILQSDIVEGMDDDGRFLPLPQWPANLRRALAKFERKLIWGKCADCMKVAKAEAAAGDLELEDVEPPDVVIGELAKVGLWSKTTAGDMLLKKLGGYAPEEHNHTMSFAEVVASQGEPDE